VIEFNARFGDPETQVVLPRMKSDLVAVIMELLEGGEPVIEWDERAVLGVVAASKGYPEAYENGAELAGLETVSNGIYVFHAGTARNEAGAFVTNGGRVLLAACKADTLQSAQQQVYQELEKLQCEGVFYRRDIGSRAIRRVHS
jgi:phosphoribosylamine--glycine ligase